MAPGEVLPLTRLCHVEETSFSPFLPSVPALLTVMSRTRQPAVNSQLQTTTESRDPSTVRLTGTLRLRGDDSQHPTEPASTRRIRWSEDVVDNEGMGKKSSKGQCSDLSFLPRETVNIAQCAVSTISLDRWARAARNQNPPTPAHPNSIVRAKQIHAATEWVVHVVRTLAGEGRLIKTQPNIPKSRTQVVAVLDILDTSTPDTRGGSQVQTHMRKCPSHPKLNRGPHDLRPAVQQWTPLCPDCVCGL